MWHIPILSFIYFTSSITIYNFTQGQIPWQMTLFLNPLDAVDIKIRNGYGTFLSYWNGAKDLFLYVKTQNKKKKEVSYGPFGIDSGLAGIVYQNKQYDVRLVNDGPDNINFSMIFSKNYPNAPYKEFPISDYMLFPSLHNIDQLPSPFIYYIDHKGGKIALIITGVIVCFFSFVPLFFGCKDT